MISDRTQETSEWVEKNGGTPELWTDLLTGRNRWEKCIETREIVKTGTLQLLIVVFNFNKINGHRTFYMYIFWTQTKRIN